MKNDSALNNSIVNGKTITLTKELLTNGDVTFVGDSNGYTLAIDETVKAPATVEDSEYWSAVENNQATFYGTKTSEGYTLDTTNNKIIYSAEKDGDALFTISGLKNDSTLTTDIVNGKTVTLTKEFLTTGTIKLTGEGYTLKLEDGLTSPVVTEGKFTAIDTTDGTAIYTTTATSDYYSKTADNSFTYVAKVDSGNLIINGLNADKLNLDNITDHITVTDKNNVITVNIKDRELLDESTVTFTKPEGYTLNINAESSVTTGTVDNNGKWNYLDDNTFAYSVGNSKDFYKVVGETLEYISSTHENSKQLLVLSGVNSQNLTADDIEFDEATGTITFKKSLGDNVKVVQSAGSYKYVFASSVDGGKFMGSTNNDTLNVSGDNITIVCGNGNDVINFTGTNGVIEMTNYIGTTTINYSTDYKISYCNQYVYEKTVGNNAFFSYGTGDGVIVTNAVGKTLNIVDSNGKEAELLINIDYDPMLTYSDNRKYGVTLNGSAETSNNSSKELFTADALKADAYSSNVISIKAGNTMTQAVSIEGNAKSNFVIGNNISGNTLNGGKGNDSVIGGTGADVFYYKRGEGNDTISNYESQDTLLLEGFTDADITADKISVSGNNLFYTLGSNKLMLQNVFKSSNQATVKIITDDNNELNYICDKSGTVKVGNTVALLANAKTYKVTPGETINNYNSNIQLTGIAVEDIVEIGTRDLGQGTSEITLTLKNSNVVINSSDGKLNLGGTVYTVGENYLANDNTTYILTGGNSDGLNFATSTNNLTIDAKLTSSDIELVGGKGNDQLIGGTGKNKFTGNGGSDVFIYSGGNDTITDYTPNVDVISLNAALDFADITFDGDDLTITGADGSLAIKNGVGKKLTINDGSGNKGYTFGNDGAINSAGTAITLQAGQNDYTATGSISTIDASSADDGSKITARDANSYITAGDKSLTLIGGTGKDTLVDGDGNSNLTGNDGNDTFIIGGGNDTITDYGNGSDSIKLTDYTMNDLTGITKSGSNVALTFGDDKLKIDSSVDMITIDGKGYTFDSDKAITNDNKGVILVTNSTVDLSTAYTDAQTIFANGGGKITAAENSVTMGGKNVTLVGGDGKDAFIYSGGSMKIENYNAATDFISLTSGYSIADSQLSGSTVTLTITDGTTSDKITIDAGNSNSVVVKTSTATELIYIKEIDFDFNSDNPATATGVTVVADNGDFGVQGDSLDSGKGIGTGKDEYYKGIKSITATKENSTLVGNANSNTFYIKGGAANILTGGIGKDYFVFNSGGGIITDYGSGATKTGAKITLADSATQKATSEYLAYDRTDPRSYMQAVDVLKVNGTVKEIAYKNYGNSNSNKTEVFSAYVTYEDNNGDDYVIKLDNIYKTPTQYGIAVYRTDDYVAKRFQIWDTSSDGSTMKERTLTDDLFTGDVTTAETLLTELMDNAKSLTTTGNLFGSSNPLSSNNTDNNSTPVIVNTNGDKTNG